GAYAARGTGVKVADETRFREHAERARAEFMTALEADPYDPSPCVSLIAIAKMTADSAFCTAMYQEGIRRAPDCYALHRAFNDSLSARWGGSHDAQLQHARTVARSAPRASLAAGLPLNALYFNLS